MKHGLKTVRTPHQISPPELTRYLNNRFDFGSDKAITREEVSNPYTKKDFLNDVYLSEEDYDRLYSLLIQKKNVILQGSPGVGKTYMAKRLAWSIMGNINDERIKTIQFHQSYSYEDFIEGYRPNKECSFDLVHGPLYEFCKKAEEDKNNSYFFIIDEINRGNISKIFGELLMLIESDKRGSDHEMGLLYSKEEFSVPKNVYFIGMMNTADRGLALIDYALRRRFSFFSVEPAFESDGFKKEISKYKNDVLKKIVGCVKDVNRAIEEDESLGSGFKIGHSYFCEKNEDIPIEMWLYNIIHFDLVPLLKEYWFDDEKNRDYWSNELKRLVK